MNKVPLMYLSQKTARVCEECFNTLANDGKNFDIILVQAIGLKCMLQKTFIHSKPLFYQSTSKHSGYMW